MTVVPTARAAVTRLTVLYDAGCPLCRWVREWLDRTALHVPLDWVPCGSEQALRRFPGLDHARTTREVTVVSPSTGEVWAADAAWIAVLWATVEHRGLAERLAEPRWRPLARQAALTIARTMQGELPEGCGYGDDRACDL